MGERYLPEEAREFKASRKPESSIFAKLRNRTLARVLGAALSLGPIVSSPSDGFAGGPDKERAVSTLEADTRLTRKLEFRGKEWTRDELNTGLLEAMRGQPDADC